jgi:hypothetical protein
MLSICVNSRETNLKYSLKLGTLTSLEKLRQRTVVYGKEESTQSSVTNRVQIALNRSRTLMLGPSYP